MSAVDSRGLLLFVPATRPDRYKKAAAAGVDGVLVDLEDAVAATEKEAARSSLASVLCSTTELSTPFFVRINAAGAPWHEADVAALVNLPIAGVMLPKAERVEDLVRLSQALGVGKRIIALVETARGVAAARELARAASRLAFGSLDFAADICAAYTREAMLSARTELVLASRLAGLPQPIDGVTPSIETPDEVADDAAYAASLGYSGKLLIHPAQAAPAARDVHPKPSDIEWARRVLASRGPVALIDGYMADAPVRRLAEQVLLRASLSSWGEAAGDSQTSAR